MLALIATLLPVFINVAEVLFPKPGSGPAKKEAVKGAIMGLAGGIAAVSKGGQADTWKAVSQLITMPVTADGKDLIDFTVERIFAIPSDPGAESGTGVQSNG